MSESEDHMPPLPERFHGFCEADSFINPKTGNGMVRLFVYGDDLGLGPEAVYVRPQTARRIAEGIVHAAHAAEIKERDSE